MKEFLSLKRIYISLSTLFVALTGTNFAHAYVYPTKAINAYDHNGNLISTQLAPDVQYIEIEDFNVEPEFYQITGEDGTIVKFAMIPVIGTNSYKLSTADIKWPEKEKRATVNTFHIGQTEVTNALWKAVMGSVPSTVNKGDNFPVETVSWNDICKAGGFLDRLNAMVRNNSELNEMLDGREFCLPSEWEWEYAAKDGNLRNTYTYAGGSEIDDLGWCLDNSELTTHEVAQKLPNDLGLYDMNGNVWELCSSPYNKNGDGTINYDMRPTRGGGFATDKGQCTNTWRGRANGKTTTSSIGFRLVLKHKPMEPKIFTLSGTDGSEIKFKMIPVAGTSSYRLASSSVASRPEDEICSNIASFFIGETEVTNALWKAVMGTLPSTVNTGDNFPVETVSWNAICNAGGFLEKLNEKMKDQLGEYEFSLPTEWEWEYAARGGNRKDNYRFSGSDNIDEVAWYQVNSENTTHEVAQKKPNGLGLYDMSGNVWEWCNGRPTNTSTQKYSRGGSYKADISNCSTTYRGFNTNNTAVGNGGLRLVLKPKK